MTRTACARGYCSERRGAYWIVSLAALLLPWTAVFADNGLDSVMRLLAQRRHGKVEFVEQRFLAVLDHPLESSGELLYDAPDRLEKRTLAPRRESVLLSGDTLIAERGGHTRTLDLQRFPQVRPFVESLRATLAGDRAALERLFRVQFSGSIERWSLELEPRDAALEKSLKQVQIEGRRDQLTRVQITQANGDRSLMTLRAAPGS